MQIKKIVRENHYTIYLLTLFTLSFIMIYLYRPFVTGHDFAFHFNRLIILMEELKSGNFTIYMDYKILDGYGYPTKIFYSDLLLVPHAIIGNITSEYIGYQSIIFVNNILCGIFSFVAFRRITNNTYSAYISSLLYTFSAYRLFDIYVRSAVGEIFAFTYLPIVLLGIYEIVYGDYKKWYILAIAFSLLIYSHILSTVLASICLVIFLLVSVNKIRKEPKRLAYLLISASICLLLSAYYIAPMLEQFDANTLYIQVEELRKPIVYFDIRSFIYSFFTIFFINYEGGYPTTGALLVMCLLCRFFIKQKTKKLIYIDILTICAILILICTTSIYPWETYPFNLLHIIQFSWRLNLISTLLISISAGYYIALALNKKIVAFSLPIILITLMIIHSVYYDKLSKYSEREEGYNNYTVEYDYNPTSGIAAAEYLPSKISQPYDENILGRGIIVKQSNDLTKISNFNKNKGYITFGVEVTNNDNLELPLTYYKGYKATLDGESIEYLQSESGLIEIPVNKSGKVEVEYVGTTLQKTSWYVSIISLALILLYVIFRKKTKK